jgi:hypothetical protein
MKIEKTTTPNSSDRDLLATAKKVAAYSATSLGAICGTSQFSSADVVEYSPAGAPITITDSDAVGFHVDMDGDAQNDFLLIWGIYLGLPTFVIDSAGLGAQNVVDATQVGDPYLVDVIPAGGTVGPSFDDSSTLALFDPFVGTRGYVGVQFDIADGGGGTANQHFGFLDVEVNAANNALTLYGGAFDDEPFTPISTVPEPNSLAFLALGAAGSVSMRRRRSGNVKAKM